MPVAVPRPNALAHLEMRCDLQAHADVVEVHVARARDRALEVDRAVAALLVTVEHVAVERGLAGAEEGRRRRDDTFLERGRRRDHLEGAARRVGALDDAVHQRRQRVARERRPDRRFDAGRELVRVVGGGGGHGEDLAGVRVERDRGARASGERLFHGALQPGVDRQGEAGAVVRLPPALCLAHLEPAAVDDHAAEAVAAHQPLVVPVLDAGLAHERAGGDRLVLGHCSCRSVISPTRPSAWAAAEASG